MIAERSTTIRPPTCASGSGQSQRSSPPSPIACARPRAFARMLPNVSATGFGVPVVPDVCMTSATLSRSGGPGSSNTPVSPRIGRSTRTSISRSTAARSRSARRGSIGTAGAPSSRQPCSASTNGRPGSSISATGSPRRTPRMCSAPGGAHRAQQQLAVRDLLIGGFDRDAVGMPPGGGRQPVSEVHCEGG